MKHIKVILSGGGTGGHIFPAVAIANELKKQMPEAEILFVGALGKMEMEKIPAAGYKIIGVPIAGLQRKLTTANFKLPFLLMRSLFQTKKILNDFKPDLVIGTGGYASAPLLRMACYKKIPALIQEQNSYAGITNKMLSKKVQKICVAYEGMERFFPKDKIILSGNPVRQDIQHVAQKKEEAQRFFNLNPSQKTILVIGGSLGAKTINEAVGENLQLIADQGVQLIWQTGKTYISIAKQQTQAFQEKNIYAFDFITRMDLAYAAADVVISRAGASSVSELQIVGKPCVLVPSPNVAEDHQTKNAMALVNKQAALLVKDADASSLLIKESLALLFDEKKQEQLKQNISKMALPHAAHTIVQEILKILS
ncbi:MAG: undecaprenyldiphospho-muramoylpentapeptide beta-N-acetylglucosaminyltransferase [Bacteroidetes bacterium]|nr:undecaprenyldiphospho-muramoylpentapeptide beta-N-acetylglucosaminyltransferase [Bacteroidota bacterium]